MKGLVLAGGRGTRLRPITYTSSKQLVPVANKPILHYVIEHLSQSGISDVGIVVGDTAEEIKASIKDGSKWGVNVTYIHQDQPMGLAHAVLISRDFLADDDFVMYLGDNLVRSGIKQFVNGFEDKRKSDPNLSTHIMLAKVEHPEKFGVAEFDDEGNVISLQEKPAEPKSDCALVGLYLFSKRIHDAVRAIEPSERGELEITDAISWLIKNGHSVSSELIDGYWKDLGELDSILEGNSQLLESVQYEVLGSVDEASKIDNRVRIEKGAVVKYSVIRGPAIIGEGALIADSYVGPFTAVGPDCQVVDSEVEHSMLLEGSSLVGCSRISDSLIGYQAKVERSKSVPKAVRLLIGDHSWVDIG